VKNAQNILRKSSKFDSSAVTARDERAGKAGIFVSELFIRMAERTMGH